MIPETPPTRVLEKDVIQGLVRIAAKAKTELGEEEVSSLAKQSKMLTDIMSVCRKTGTAFLNTNPDSAIAKNQEHQESGADVDLALSEVLNRVPETPEPEDDDPIDISI